MSKNVVCSSPNVSYDGTPTGTVNLNNARVAKFRAPTIAQFEPTISSKIYFFDDTIRNRESAVIVAGTSLSTNGYNVIFENGSKGIFISGGSITLKPGFQVEKGSNFVAKIDNCTDPIQDDEVKELLANGGMQTVLHHNLKSVDDQSTIKIDIFPNPANHFINVNVQTEKEETLQIDIFDMNGKYIANVASQQVLLLGVHHFSFNSNPLTPGMYQIKVKTSKSLNIRKFIKVDK